jgi:ABC-type uncharacterized transport system fused permease/ATPase subunit
MENLFFLGSVLDESTEKNNLIAVFDLQIRKGMNTIFSGPWGCGKTAFFRIIFGLWPVREGVVTRPNLGKMMFIGAKMYMPKGYLLLYFYFL